MAVVADAVGDYPRAAPAMSGWFPARADVCPGGTRGQPTAERVQRAQNARKAYYQRRALKSANARRRREATR